MCGIVGAIAQRPIAGVLLAGLKALEYRGYDSAGVAFLDHKRCQVIKSTGKVSALAKQVHEAHADGTMGIAHTRWATHGEPSVVNAHPQRVGSITIVHNGIIENYRELRQALSAKGYVFVSATDTEVLAALIHEECYHHAPGGASAAGADAAGNAANAAGNAADTADACDSSEVAPGALKDAFMRALAQVNGSYAVAMMDDHDSNTIYAARHGSPLVLGLGIGENFLASDVLALLPVTSNFIYLEEGDIVLLGRESYEIYNSAGAKITHPVQSITASPELLGKGSYKHYMQKEIFEQPEALLNTMLGRLGEDDVTASAFMHTIATKPQAITANSGTTAAANATETSLAANTSATSSGASAANTSAASSGASAATASAANSGARAAAASSSLMAPSFKDCLSTIKHIEIVACGTSYHASLVGQYFLEEYAGVSTNVSIASEYRYKRTIVPEHSLFVTLSQSGETADTLAALKLAKEQGYEHTLCICNVANSSLVRSSEFAFLTRAGAEIGVASTKAFTTQLIALAMLTLALGRANGEISSKQGRTMVQALLQSPRLLEDVLKLDPAIATLALQFVGKQHALFLGRGTMYPIALEGALKLKEISYIHAEGYASGELKHGPIALIDSNMPVIVVAPDNQWLPKLISNIEEVKARGGRLYIFAGSHLKINEAEQEQCTSLTVGAVDPFISPIIFTVPLQLLAYHVAVINGTDVDQPRNLAKSVTVE